jgi:lipid II:glycine glycyltransferase (peptidoglycan interpeptide bridge formation enzyme)
MIRRITHKEIDKKLWDNCILNSQNENIYPYSEYLDIVSPGWDGLVLNNYQAVFPVTHKRKFGINYLIQPPNAQQLGLFSVSDIDAETEAKFLKYLSDEFSYINIQINSFYKTKIPDLSFIAKKNYELKLNSSHENLFSKYSTNHKRNIKKAIESGIRLEKNFTPEKLISLYKETRGSQIRHSKTDYKILETLINQSLSNKSAEIIAAFLPEIGFCGGAVFVRSKKKTVFLFSATGDDAKNNGVMHYLIDNYIKENSKNDIVLDFEGSNQESLARFYAGFGAQCTEYFTVKKNKLPGFLKLIKK